MKKTLYWKLLLGYLIFGILGFILVSTATAEVELHYLEKHTASDLYREATLVANKYAAEYYKNTMTLSDLNNQFKALDTYLSSEIWLINTDGDILVNSGAPVDLSNLERIDSFNATDFGSRYYQIGHFYNYFSQDYLSVFAPITVNYKVKGYIVIHKPLSVITSFNNRLLNFSYLTLGLLAACALLLIILFVFFVVHPIHKIAKSVARYADGDFSKKIDVHTNDEIGYLAASIDYMANEMNTLEEDQRKFVSNVSHDFRSPLTSIKGYVEAMLDGTIPPELQDKYLNIILFETERLNKLTNSILELNKYGSHGRTILDTGNFDINHVIKMTAMTFEGRCKEKHLSFELILTGQTLFVRADMSKIEQVVYNLIDNAIKFSHNDSTITIETTEKNGKVFVSVKDTGIGIPKDSLNKIWERFYKTDLSRGKDKKGTGLGLAIVKEIIQAHGENINVISTEGVGTEFIFTLPLAKEKSAGSEN